MKTIHPLVRWCCLTLIISALFSFSSFAQNLATDYPDYPPGTTAFITGSGFNAGETVTLQVLHTPTCCDNPTASWHQPWNVIADGNGDISTSWYVNTSELGATLVASADGQSSGLNAVAYFTDGNCPVNAAITITCADDVMTLCAMDTHGGSHNLFYAWTPNGETTECITGVVGQTYGVTVTKVCGTNNQESSSVTITPTQCGALPPQITCSNGQNLGCGGSVPAADNSTVTVLYGCSTEHTITSSDDDVATGCDHVLTRTYTVTDACNQTASCSQIFTYSTVGSAPTFSGCPSGGALGCNPASIPDYGDFSPTASNECGSATVSGSSSDQVSGCNHTRTIIYTATAPCGATNTCSAQYTWTVTTPIGLSCSAGGIGACHTQEEVDAAYNAWLGSATTSGGCGTSVSASGSGSPNRCGGTATATWTATDACHTETCSNAFTVASENTLGTSGCGNSNQAACLSQATLNTNYTNWLNSVSATGGCSASVSNNNTASAPDKCVGGSRTVTWTVTDGSGCQSPVQCTQTFTAPATTLTASATTDNPVIFFGLSSDNKATMTASSAGGCGTRTNSWSASRGILCNVANSSGDEQFGGGWNVSCSCSGTSCTTPVGTYTGSTFWAILTGDENFTLTVTDGNGCTAASTVHIDAVDARCFSGNSGAHKVNVCHHTGSSHNPYVTICVDEDAVPALLALGDCVGPCAAYSNPMNCSGVRPEGTQIDNNTMNAEAFNVYPNPFHNKATVSFSVPTDGNTIVKVFDAYGREVKVLFDGMAKSGTEYKVEFDGAAYSDGMYFYSIISGDMNVTKKMQLIK
jgi:hypothetical protein